jgi:hypothetical protein
MEIDMLVDRLTNLKDELDGIYDAVLDSLDEALAIQFELQEAPVDEE